MSIQSIASPGLITATHTAASANGSQTPARAGSSEQVADAASTVPSAVTSSSPVSATEQKQQVEAAVKAVKDFIQPMASNLAFEMDEDTGRTVVKITDASSGELIRQIPSEEMLEIAKALDRLQGLLVKLKAYSGAGTDLLAHFVLVLETAF